MFDIEQADAMKRTGKLPTMKDLNWKRRIVLRDTQLSVGLLKQLEDDTQFLASNNIMDYSLLVGVSTATGSPDLSKEGQSGSYRSPYQTDFGGLRATTGEIYFLGLIDILQVYNVQKQLERFMKANVRSALNDMVLRKQAQDDILVEELTCTQCERRFKQGFNTDATRTLFQGMSSYSFLSLFRMTVYSSTMHALFV